MLKSTMVALLLSVGLSTTTLAFAEEAKRTETELLQLVYEYDNGERKLAIEDGNVVAITWRECRDMGGWKWGHTCVIRAKGLP
jgi:hypothetical protein